MSFRRVPTVRPARSTLRHTFTRSRALVNLYCLNTTPNLANLHLHHPRQVNVQLLIQFVQILLSSMMRFSLATLSLAAAGSLVSGATVDTRAVEADLTSRSVSWLHVCDGTNFTGLCWDYISDLFENGCYNLPWEQADVISSMDRRGGARCSAYQNEHCTGYYHSVDNQKWSWPYLDLNPASPQMNNAISSISCWFG